MILFWYPRCSTCIKAKKFLDDNNVSYELRDIVSNNPNYQELEDLLEKSNLDIKRFFNTSGLLYRSMNLKEKLDNMSLDEKLELLSSNGMLVKRPILVDNNKVLVGFKKEEWSNL